MAGVTVTYGHNDADQLTSASNQTATPTYDGAGNQTTGPDGLVATFNHVGQTASHAIGSISADYDYSDADSTERTWNDGIIEHNSILGLVARDDGTTTTAWRRDPTGQLLA